MKPVIRYAAALALAGATPLAGAQVRITEFMYDGPNKEFVEITNVGTTPVDLTGWSYDDDSNTAGSVPIGSLGTLAAGESAVIAENTAEAFRTAWGLCAAAKIVGGSTHNLGRADTINLYDGGGTRVDFLRYGDQTFPGTIRTQNASGWVSAAGLGNDQIAQWTLATVGDAEHSRLSAGNEIGSPGLSTRAATPFDPCAPIGPRMRITEYMYDSANNGEFVEFTNVGDAPADMTGWSFDDDSNAPGTVSLGAYGTVQPGESVLFTDQAAATIRTAWGLCAGVKVIGGNTVGLGRADTINLYDNNNQQIDKLAYGDQAFPGT
ncbi:MAG TPA: lamin tail domain-containing protein, partial [Tahibacter sp.]|nr:lamin tail domain-containing protein [Tahibacter sp.]